MLSRKSKRGISSVF